MLRKIRTGFKGVVALKEEFGISYAQILKAVITKEKINLNVNGIQINANLRKAFYIAINLREIKKAGWEISVNNNLIAYRNGNIKLFGKIDEDFGYAGTINEVFVKEAYKANIKDKVVIDVGAYRGESAIYFISQGAKKVIALEPAEESYRFALMNIHENKLEDKIVLLNKAVGAQKGSIELNILPNAPACNSTISTPGSEVKKVDAVTLDEVINMAGGERIGLLKMDCEGCEYSVLSSFSHFDIIDGIILEYHNDPQQLPGLLKSNGFDVEVKKVRGKVGYLKAFK